MQRVGGTLRFLSVLQLGQDTEKILRLPVGVHHICRQVAVQCVRDLVDVVSDVAKLSEQRRVKLKVAGSRLNFPVADQTLAQSGE